VGGDETLWASACPERQALALGAVNNQLKPRTKKKRKQLNQYEAA